MGNVLAPKCKVKGCSECLAFWGCYWRVAVRGEDGKRLNPLPICRFMCPVLGHGTTSWLPDFLHRYLHYMAPIVDKAVEGVSGQGKELWDLIELDGPSVDTVHRWNAELTCIPVRERLLQRLPSMWRPTRDDCRHPRPEQAFTWKVALALRDCFQLKIAFVSRLLQQTRLSLMIRYFTL